MIQAKAANKTSKKRAAANTSSSSTTSSNKKSRLTAKSCGLTKDEFASIALATIKRELKQFVKTLAKQVREDWHDGYEEQGGTICNWFHALGRFEGRGSCELRDARANGTEKVGILQRVINIGVGKKAALFQCNEILKAVADSWFSLCAVPMRGTVEEQSCHDGAKISLMLPGMPAGESADTFYINVKEKTWMYVWIALLRVHAAKEDVDQPLLLQCVQDATVHGVLFDPSDEDGPVFETLLEAIDEEGNVNEKVLPNNGAALDVILANKQAWQSLPSTRVTHKMGKVRDSRF